MNDNTMVIPKDFEVNTIEKSWFDEDVITVIYFDEKKWRPEEIEKWHDMIYKFTDCPLMMLPKSFSSLQYFTNEQMLLLKDIVDNAVNEMNRNDNN